MIIGNLELEDVDKNLEDLDKNQQNMDTNQQYLKTLVSGVVGLSASSSSNADTLGI